MKKTIEQYFCDDCGKRIYNTTESFGLTIKSEKNSGECVREYMLFCLSCIEWRVSHSFKTIEDRRCPECKGKGKVKEHCGYHNDYVYKVCTICKGKGVS